MRSRSTIFGAVLVLATQQSCGVATRDAKPNPAQGGSNAPSGGTSGLSLGDSSGGSTRLSGGAGVVGFGGVDATGGSLTLGLGGTSGAGGPSCNTFPSRDEVPTFFPGQAVPQSTGKPRVFYSWTTSEQVAELRAGTPLFSRSERPGLGRGVAFAELDAFAQRGSQVQHQLAKALSQNVFAKARYAWTNPWATLRGWPGEDYGDELLQIELKPDAWIAVFTESTLLVVDARDNPVPLELALAHPEWIGAIYFIGGKDENAVSCGTFAASAVSFREFVLGNPQMVQRWSLSTDEIRERLESDITEVEAFRVYLSHCRLPTNQSLPEWRYWVICSWYETTESRGLDGYNHALAIPSDYYWPTVENMDALLDALRQSTSFDGPPLIFVAEE